MEPLDFGPLPVFVAVAEASSFSAAAARLGLPRSSVSRTVAQLEAHLGVQLLHRTTRRVSLSTAGQALYEKAAPLLKQLQRSVGELPELGDEPRGALKVTTAVDFGVAVLAEVVTRYVARYPEVEVELHLSSRVVDLVAEGFDVALRIAMSPLKDSSLSARALGEMALQLYASPGYLARRGTPRTPRELEGHAWAIFRGRGPVILEGPQGKVSLSPSGRIVCDDMFFLREAVRSGAGVGLLPRFLAQPDLAAGALVPVLKGHTQQGGKLWFVTPGGRKPPPKVTALRELLVQALKEHPLAG